LTKPNLCYVIITCFPREPWHCQTFDIFLGKILNVNVLVDKKTNNLVE